MRKILALSLMVFAFAGTKLSALELESHGPFSASMYIGGGSSIDEAGFITRVGGTLGVGWVFGILGFSYNAVLGGAPASPEHWQAVNNSVKFEGGGGLQIPMSFNNFSATLFAHYSWMGGQGTLAGTVETVTIHAHAWRVGLLFGSFNRHIGVTIDTGMVIPYRINSKNIHHIRPTPVIGMKLVWTIWGWDFIGLI